MVCGVQLSRAVLGLPLDVQRASSSIRARLRTRSRRLSRASLFSTHTNSPALTRPSSSRSVLLTSSCVTCHRPRPRQAPTSAISLGTPPDPQLEHARGRATRASCAVCASEHEFDDAARAAVEYTLLATSARTAHGPTENALVCDGWTVFIPATCSIAFRRALSAAFLAGTVPTHGGCGLRYYADALITPDGTPRYRPDSRYPIDGQCVAQALKTLSLGAASEPRPRGFARPCLGLRLTGWHSRPAPMSFNATGS